jgi:hypothetical protein
MTRAAAWVEDRRQQIAKVYWVIAWIFCILAFRWLFFAAFVNAFAFAAVILHPVDVGDCERCHSPTSTSLADSSS